MPLHVLLDHFVDRSTTSFRQANVDSHNMSVQHIDVKVLLVAKSTALQIGICCFVNLSLNTDQIVQAIVQMRRFLLLCRQDFL